MTHHTWDIVLAGLLIASWVSLVCVAAFPLWRRLEPDAHVQTVKDGPPDAPLAPQAAPKSAPKPTLMLHLMCGDHKHEIARVQIPSHTRRPSIVHGGQIYMASKRRPSGDWEYRWIGAA